MGIGEKVQIVPEKGLGMWNQRGVKRIAAPDGQLNDGVLLLTGLGPRPDSHENRHRGTFRIHSQPQ